MATTMRRKSTELELRVAKKLYDLTTSNGRQTGLQFRDEHTLVRFTYLGLAREIIQEIADAAV